uniref:Uncharacterized protein n=1 Tax=Oryza brachyantha TaxID=4533 RepID=J3LZH3_ORYBR
MSSKQEQNDKGETLHVNMSSKQEFSPRRLLRDRTRPDTPAHNPSKFEQAAETEMATTPMEHGQPFSTVWTPLYPGFLYDPARFRSMTLEGFVYDPVLPLVDTEEDVTDDIANLCMRIKNLQERAEAFAPRHGGGVESGEVVTVANDDDGASDQEAFFADRFAHIIDLVEELLDEEEDEWPCPLY